MQIKTVQQYKSDVAFKTLVEGIDDNLYFIPKYQRKFRWKKEQVQDLIYSLVKGYPIPPVYAYRNQQGQLEILDGQQRIMSLFFYYIGKFIDSKKVSAVDYRKMSIENMKYSEALEKTYGLIDLYSYLEYAMVNSMICLEQSMRRMRIGKGLEGGRATRVMIWKCY